MKSVEFTPPTNGAHEKFISIDFNTWKQVYEPMEAKLRSTEAELYKEQRSKIFSISFKIDDWAYQHAMQERQAQSSYWMQQHYGDRNMLQSSRTRYTDNRVLSLEVDIDSPVNEMLTTEKQEVLRIELEKLIGWKLEQGGNLLRKEHLTEEVKQLHDQALVLKERENLLEEQRKSANLEIENKTIQYQVKLSEGRENAKKLPAIVRWLFKIKYL